MSDSNRSSSGNDVFLPFNSGTIAVEEINYLCATFGIWLKWGHVLKRIFNKETVKMVEILLAHANTFPSLINLGKVEISTKREMGEKPIIEHSFCSFFSFYFLLVSLSSLFHVLCGISIIFPSVRLIQMHTLMPFEFMHDKIQWIWLICVLCA